MEKEILLNEYSTYKGSDNRGFLYMAANKNEEEEQENEESEEEDNEDQENQRQ